MTAAWIEDLLARAVRRLRGAGVDEPELCAAYLVAEVVGCRRLDLPFVSVTPPAEEGSRRRRRLVGLVERLAAGEPLQYVLGHVEFMGLRLQIDARALIPRPETEELVECALRYARGYARAAVADVGVGCGCIAIALARMHPGLTVWALDASAPALDLAAENVRRHALEGRIRLIRSDVLAAVRNQRFQLIVSNPPYIAEEEYADLPPHIRDHEPGIALTGGPAGLAVLARLIDQAYASLAAGGRLVAEIGARQGPAVKARMKARGFRSVEIRQDLAGRDRIATGCRETVE